MKGKSFQLKDETFQQFQNFSIFFPSEKAIRAVGFQSSQSDLNGQQMCRCSNMTQLNKGVILQLDLTPMHNAPALLTLSGTVFWFQFDSS